MALFQPILTSAKWIKRAATTASALGLSSLWARQKLYISGTPCLSEMLGSKDLHYAYFTGTDSPHRKAAIQIMDAHGHIKGFAKLSRTPTVRELLAHEADVLTRLAALNLQTAHLPTLLHAGEHNGGRLLVTDTLKTAKTKTVTNLKPQHTAFLQELAQKTSSTQDGRTVAALKRRYAAVANRLAPEWRQRYDHGLARLQDCVHELLPPTLTHGDFTPWNTFFVDGKLYVFDWEYAETDYPASNDLFHFLLATPGFRKRPPTEQIKHLTEHIKAGFILRADSLALSHLMIYLLSQTLRYIERSNGEVSINETWDGEEESARIIDAALKLNSHQ